MLKALQWYVCYLCPPASTDAEALCILLYVYRVWHRIMVLLKLSVGSLGHSETDPKIKRSAYAAQLLLASYHDELVGYFQL